MREKEVSYTTGFSVPVPALMLSLGVYHFVVTSKWTIREMGSAYAFPDRPRDSESDSPPGHSAAAFELAANPAVHPCPMTLTVSD